MGYIEASLEYQYIHPLKAVAHVGVFKEDNHLYINLARLNPDDSVNCGVHCLPLTRQEALGLAQELIDGANKLFD